MNCKLIVAFWKISAIALALHQKSYTNANNSEYMISYITTAGTENYLSKFAEVELKE